jgi:hypothetical protein
MRSPPGQASTSCSLPPPAVVGPVASFPESRPIPINGSSCSYYPQKFLLLTAAGLFVHPRSHERTNKRVGARLSRSDENESSVSKGFPRRCDWLRFTDIAKGASQRHSRALFLRNVACRRSQKSLIFSQAASIALLLFPRAPSRQRTHWSGESPNFFTYANT